METNTNVPEPPRHRLFQDSVEPPDKTTDHQNNLQIPVNGLPGPTKLFSQAWNLYRNNFWLLIGIYSAPFTLIIMWLLLYYADRTPGLNLAVGIFLTLFTILFIALIYFGLWSTAALIQAAEILIDDVTKKVSFKEAFSESRGKLWALFGASLLSGLAVLGGTILLIIPGIIFFSWFSLSSYVAIAEGVKDSKALSASKQYVKGRTGGVLWRWIFLGIIYLVTVFVLAFILVLLPLQQNVVELIEKIIIAIFWTPFATVYGYLLYHYLKKSKAISS